MLARSIASLQAGILSSNLPEHVDKMAQDRPPANPSKDTSNPKKRKHAPHQPNHVKPDNNKRPKVDHRAKQRDARQLSTQTASKAFKNGELDVDKFVRAREFEIRALEEGMQRSKKALNRRAFQQVPKELRRRTASHNVKKIPKRLRGKGKREVCDRAMLDGKCLC